jgi:hypothetical protein
MSRKKNWLGFNLMPGSWGLIGKAYDEAKAYYELDGIDLRRRLIDIKLEGNERKKAHLEIDFELDLVDEYEYMIDKLRLSDNPDPEEILKIDLKYKKIDQYDYDIAMAKRMFSDENSIEYQSAMLTADYRAGKITKNEYEKTMAIAHNEPWVGITEHGYNSEEGIDGLFFELDWNDQWVDYLKLNGYIGFTSEQIVDQWFSDVCRSQASVVVDDMQPVPFNSRRVINRLKDGDSTEYS